MSLKHIIIECAPLSITRGKLKIKNDFGWSISKLEGFNLRGRGWGAKLLKLSV